MIKEVGLVAAIITDIVHLTIAQYPRLFIIYIFI